MINQEKIDEARAVDILELASDFTELTKKNSCEYAGPCPMCGGHDRFIVSTLQNRAYCRYCNTRGFDSVDLLMRLKGLSFPQSVFQLTRGKWESTGRVKPSAKVGKPAYLESWWQEKAARRLEAEKEAILSHSKGREYLQHRGITLESVKRYGLGYSESIPVPTTKGKVTAPAIAIPWLAEVETGQIDGYERPIKKQVLAGIRYRFLETQTVGEDTYKKTALHGSTLRGYFYGQPQLDIFSDTLVICEGEINAISVAKIQGYTALSVGSEGQSITEEMRRLTRRFKHVIAWFDRPEYAAKARDILNEGRYSGDYGFTPALAVSLPNCDANDLLRISPAALKLALDTWRKESDH